jgi:hypothetical protein
MSSHNDNGMRTRSGKQIVHDPRHYGRYAAENATLPGQKKYKTESRSTEKRNAPATSPSWKIPEIKSLPANRTSMITRAGMASLTCSHFGLSRREKYPGYRFCSNCDMWDASISCSLVASRIKRTSARFKCQSNHSSFVFPTDTINNTMRKNNKKSPKRKQHSLYGYDDSSIDDDVSSRDSSTNIEVVYCSSDSSVVETDFKDATINEEKNPEEYYIENSVLKRSFNEVKEKYEALLKENNEITQKYNVMVENYNAIKNEYQKQCIDLNLVFEQYHNISSGLESLLSKQVHGSNNTFSSIHLVDQVSIELKKAKKLFYNEKQKNVLVQKKYENLKSFDTNFSFAKFSVETLVKRFMDHLKIMARSKNRNCNKLIKFVVNELFKDKIFNGTMKAKMIEKCHEYYRTKFFHPHPYYVRWTWLAVSLVCRELKYYKKLMHLVANISEEAYYHPLQV